MQWPPVTPMRTSSLQGRWVSLPGWTPGQPLTVDLSEGISGRPLQSVTTRDGSFSFRESKPGYYWLRVQGAGLASGDAVAVELDPRAPAGMELEAMFNSCGIMFTNQIECRQPVLTLQHLAGRVADSTGAGIPQAEVHLLAHDRPVRELVTGETGDFSLRLEDGVYEMVVRRQGFTSLRTSVKIDPQAESNRVEVRLGVWGGDCAKILKQ